MAEIPTYQPPSEVIESPPFELYPEFVVAEETFDNVIQEPPLAVRLAMNATQEGKYGLKGLQIVDPNTNLCVKAETLDGMQGKEIRITDPDGNESYWAMDGTHICGYEPQGDYMNIIWSRS